MSDAALSSDSPVSASRSKYDPAKDRERMRVYMSHVRAKNRAGFQGTVKAWLLREANSNLISSAPDILAAMSSLATE